MSISRRVIVFLCSYGEFYSYLSLAQKYMDVLPERSIRYIEKLIAMMLNELCRLYDIPMHITSQREGYHQVIEELERQKLLPVDLINKMKLTDANENLHIRFDVVIEFMQIFSDIFHQLKLDCPDYFFRLPQIDLDDEELQDESLANDPTDTFYFWMRYPSLYENVYTIRQLINSQRSLEQTELVALFSAYQHVADFLVNEWCRQNDHIWERVGDVAEYRIQLLELHEEYEFPMSCKDFVDSIKSFFLEFTLNHQDWKSSSRWLLRQYEAMMRAIHDFGGELSK